MYSGVMVVPLLIMLLLSCSASAKNRAIEAVKDNAEVRMQLTRFTATSKQVEYGSVKLGEICGFVGCQWRELVSIVITSKSSNAPTETLLLMVEGTEPERGAKPSVRFVELINKK